MSAGFINGVVELAGIQGVTDGSNASAGEVGEFLSSTVTGSSPLTITTGVADDLTTLALTAGDWDLFGNCRVETTVADSIISFVSVFSTVSNTFSPEEDRTDFLTTANGTSIMSFPTPSLRISISAPQTFFSVVLCSGGGVLTAAGNMFARRVR